MYAKISNPITNKSFSILSKEGKQVLLNYINYSQRGGSISDHASENKRLLQIVKVAQQDFTTSSTNLTKAYQDLELHNKMTTGNQLGGSRPLSLVKKILGDELSNYAPIILILIQKHGDLSPNKWNYDDLKKTLEDYDIPPVDSGKCIMAAWTMWKNQMKSRGVTIHPTVKTKLNDIGISVI